MAPFIVINRPATEAEFAKYQADDVFCGMEFTDAETVRLLKGASDTALRYARILDLDQAAEMLRGWDDDCNEGRATLWAIDDAAVRSLI